jgi:segregation and condensation protein A
MSASLDAVIDDGAGEGRTPLLSLEGYHGTLEALLTLARGQKIDLATISVLDLVDQLAVALRDAPAATPMGQKGDWMVMASWLVQMRARLLLPADAPAHQIATDEADRFRNRLSDLAEIQALAGWLEDRPQLGRDVFVRGRPFDNIDPTHETVPDLDVIEFLWAGMALFDDGGASVDVAETYRPPSRELYAIPEARARILQRLAETPDGLSLHRLLPAEAADDTNAIRKRSAWTSTLVASLELTKQGEVMLAQTAPFSAIHVRPAPAEPA